MINQQTQKAKSTIEHSADHSIKLHKIKQKTNHREEKTEKLAQNVNRHLQLNCTFSCFNIRICRI